ncbi:MAG: fibronectin type III domain-containing protein, partial [Victivallales bacterium]|nr:fibronectin type III domain-containing protein [Victivallales bacterium]
MMHGICALAVVMLATGAVSAATGLHPTSVSQTRVTLAWTAEDGESVQVWRDGTLVGQSSEGTFSDCGLTAATDYVYRVASDGEAGETVTVRTMQSMPRADFQSAAMVAETMHGQSWWGWTATTLLTVARTALESLCGSPSLFTSEESEILEDFIERELEEVASEGQMSAEERQAAAEELRETLDSLGTGLTFEDMYFHVSLAELAGRFRAIGGNGAAAMLLDSALEFATCSESLTAWTLNDLLKTLQADVQGETREAFAERLGIAFRQRGRFAMRFPDSDSDLASQILRLSLLDARHSFPYILRHDGQYAALQEEAERLLDSWVAKQGASPALEQQIRDWRLVWTTVSLGNGIGGSHQGTLHIRDVTVEKEPPGAIFGDSFEDAWSVALEGEAVAVPCLAGHIYELTVDVSVGLGQAPLRFAIPDYRPIEGLARTVTSLGVDESQLTPGRRLNLVVPAIDYPYNLRCAEGVDFARINWEWLPPAGFELDKFIIYLDGLAIGETDAPAAFVTLADAEEHTVAIAARDQNGCVHTRSRPLPVRRLEHLQADWLTWRRIYFGEADGIDALADADGDGSCNYDEFTAGTDPLLCPGPAPVLRQRGYTALSMFWDEPPGLEGSIYEIRRDGVLLGNASSPEFQDGGLLPGTTPCYQVRVPGATDWSVAVTMATLPEDKWEGHDKVRQLVDSFLGRGPGEFTGRALLAAVQTAIGTLCGTAVGLSPDDAELVSELVEGELADLRLATPYTGATVSATEHQDEGVALEETLESEWGGATLESVYVGGMLSRLASRYWKAYLENPSDVGKRENSLQLDDASLLFLPGSRQFVLGVLHDMAGKTMHGVSGEALPDACSASARLISRYNAFFPGEAGRPNAQISFPAYYLALRNYWNHFPELLTYDNYHQDFFNAAVQLAGMIDWDLWHPGARGPERFAAWRLDTLLIEVTAGSGRLEIHNCSTSGSPPGWRPENDVRVLELESGVNSIPVYAGHPYRLVFLSQSNDGGSMPLRQELDWLPGKQGVFSFDAWQGLSLENASAESTLIKVNLSSPETPYNLAASEGGEFTLSWEWCGDSPLRFEVYRGEALESAVDGTA